MVCCVMIRYGKVSMICLGLMYGEVKSGQSMISSGTMGTVSLDDC